MSGAESHICFSTQGLNNLQSSREGTCDRLVGGCPDFSNASAVAMHSATLFCARSFNFCIEVKVLYKLHYLIGLCRGLYVFDI